MCMTFDRHGNSDEMGWMKDSSSSPHSPLPPWTSQVFPSTMYPVSSIFWPPVFLTLFSIPLSICCLPSFLSDFLPSSTIHFCSATADAVSFLTKWKFTEGISPKKEGQCIKGLWEQRKDFPPTHSHKTRYLRKDETSHFLPFFLSPFQDSTHMGGRVTYQKYMPYSFSVAWGGRAHYFPPLSPEDCSGTEEKERICFPAI